MAKSKDQDPMVRFKRKIRFDHFCMLHIEGAERGLLPHLTAEDISLFRRYIIHYENAGDDEKAEFDRLASEALFRDLTDEMIDFAILEGTMGQPGLPESRYKN